jgi:hypothetical protein
MAAIKTEFVAFKMPIAMHPLVEFFAETAKHIKSTRNLLRQSLNFPRLCAERISRHTYCYPLNAKKR